METIQIGLIGAGWVIHNRHLPGLRDVSSTTVTRIWSRQRKNAECVASEHGIDRVVEDWHDIIDSSNVDAVIVAAPPNLHAEASIAALHSGKHVLCQGRMARNLSEAVQMQAAADKADCVAALYPPKPGLKGDRVLQRLLNRETTLGRFATCG